MSLVMFERERWSRISLVTKTSSKVSTRTTLFLCSIRSKRVWVPNSFVDTLTTRLFITLSHIRLLLKTRVLPSSVRVSTKVEP